MPNLTNPFYSGQASIPPPAVPPSSSRPQPPPPPRASGQPTQYGSLKDLTSGRSQSHAPPSYDYVPQPERQGYRPAGHFDEGTGQSGTSGSGGASVGGRRVPPPPSNYGGVPKEPPKRYAPDLPARPSAPQTQSKWSSATATAGSYVPNSVSATASSVADKARDGFDNVFTQQRRDQVLEGAGKTAAGAAKGAAKLAGKAAWSLGKFASK